MSLHQKIIEEAKQAMLKKDEPRLTVLKSVKAAFANELLAQKGKPQTELADEEALAILRRLVKQRKDSVEQFSKGGRQDLVKSETSELKILEAYLPAQMNEEDIIKIVKKKKTELGIVDKTKAGMLMSVIMKELKGKADGTIVKSAVDRLLGGDSR